MKLDWKVAIVILNLVIDCVFTGRIIQCKPPTVINAVISCSTDPLPNGNYVNLTRCRIFCKDGLVQSSGPSTIDCYRGNWLHGGDDHVIYKTPTECKSNLPAVSSRPMAFGRSAKLLRLGFTLETNHDGICSNSHCDRRYSGITKRLCLKFKCCWNEEKKDCYEHLQSECQIPTAKRSRCVGTWKGISERQCVRKKCCFDGEMRECYSTEVAVKGTQVRRISLRQENTNITAKPCDLKIDLSTGKLSYSDEISKTLITVIEKPKPPTRSNAVFSVGGQCDYQSLLEIQYDKMTAFKIYIKYGVPSGYNFHITSKENATADGESLWVSNHHLNGTPEISRRRMIASESDIMLQITKTSDEVIYKVGKTKKWPLPINFNNANTIKVGLNRGVFLSNPFDITKMGSGVCSLCVKYS